MPRTAGFRCSWGDALVLALTPPPTWWLWREAGLIAGVVPFAVGHFFLFCNVFRIQRGKELLWAAICLVNVGTVTAFELGGWGAILALQTPVTVAAIAWEMRGPSYHGIWARRINPRIGAYLAGRTS